MAVPNKLIVWPWYIACFVFGFGLLPTPSALVWLWWRLALALTLAAHAAEFWLKRELFLQLGGNQGRHFAQTLLYGFPYWYPLELELAAAAASAKID